MSSVLELIAVAAGGGVLSLKMLAVWSHTRNAARGIIDGKLAPNNPSPNSACSEGEAANITPIKVEETESWENIQDAIESLSGRFEVLEEDYIHAVFRTPIWGFEEDLEVRFDREANLIHIRSSSRVGYTDNGSNSRRIENLKRILD